MRRYLLFVGEKYESQGWGELFQGDFDTLEEAQGAIETPPFYGADWFEIVDTDIKEIVETATIYRWLEKREG